MGKASSAKQDGDRRSRIAAQRSADQRTRRRNRLLLASGAIVAVVAVVLYHARVGWVSGGYVGVDVFFVISGFVITGVLLRERVSSGRTSILAFYGRRCRRIIPAATLVIIAAALLLANLTPLQNRRWAYAAGVALIAVHAVMSQIEPVKRLLRHDRPEVICDFYAYAARVEKFPTCPKPSP